MFWHLILSDPWAWAPMSLHKGPRMTSALTNHLIKEVLGRRCSKLAQACLEMHTPPGSLPANRQTGMMPLEIHLTIQIKHLETFLSAHLVITFPRTSLREQSKNIYLWKCYVEGCSLLCSLQGKSRHTWWEEHQKRIKLLVMQEHVSFLIFIQIDSGCHCVVDRLLSILEALGVDTQHHGKRAESKMNSMYCSCNYNICKCFHMRVKIRNLLPVFALGYWGLGLSMTHRFTL